MIPDDQTPKSRFTTPEEKRVVRAATRLLASAGRISLAETHAARERMRATMGYLEGTESSNIDTTKRLDGQPSAANVFKRLPASGFASFRRATKWIASIGVAVALVVTGLLVRFESLDAINHSTMTTYVTNKGERAKIVLPDGTHVMLNVASHIDIPRDYGVHKRVVHLQGEADFDVTHTKGSPFIVEANGTQTTVLGTEFSVRAYPSSNVRVAVRSGKVTINQTVLAANDIAHLSAGGVMQVFRQQFIDTAFAFTRGQLVVANQPLRQAIPDLDRWYNVDIRLGDPSVGDIHMDAILTDGSIGDLMEVLSNAQDVRLVREGRTLTLYPR
jgi:ferric-dicitrate binding protein FerR (iron transport regulator)